MTAPISYNMAGAVSASGMSRSALDRAIRAGKLKAKRTSEDEETGKGVGSFVIKAADLEAFIDSLVDAG